MEAAAKCARLCRGGDRVAAVVVEPKPAASEHDLAVATRSLKNRFGHNLSAIVLLRFPSTRQAAAAMWPDKRFPPTKMLGDYMRGEHWPRCPMADRLSRQLDVDVGEFFARPDDLRVRVDAGAPFGRRRGTTEATLKARTAANLRRALGVGTRTEVAVAAFPGRAAGRGGHAGAYRQLLEYTTTQPTHRWPTATVAAALALVLEIDPSAIFAAPRR